jgi:hypothetical protein
MFGFHLLFVSLSEMGKSTDDSVVPCVGLTDSKVGLQKDEQELSKIILKPGVMGSSEPLVS